MIVARSGPRVPVFGMPEMSWHEMHPSPPLPMIVLPASTFAVVSVTLRTVSSGAVPSRRASDSGREPTFASPYCGIRSCIHGRARPPWVSTDFSHDVRALWPMPVNSGGRTSSAFSAFSISRIASASSGGMPPSPSLLWQLRQLNRFSASRAACAGAGDPAPVSPSFRNAATAADPVASSLYCGAVSACDSGERQPFPPPAFRTSPSEGNAAAGAIASPPGSTAWQFTHPFVTSSFCPSSSHCRSAGSFLNAAYCSGVVPDVANTSPEMSDGLSPSGAGIRGASVSSVTRQR